MAITEKLKAALAWVWAQITGVLSNLWDFVTDKFRWKDVLLPAIYDSIVWLVNQLPLALGFGRRDQMIEASVVLAVATFFTGFVTGGAAWAIIALWVLTFMIGLWRLVPAVEKRWPLSGDMVWYDPGNVSSLREVLNP